MRILLGVFAVIELALASSFAWLVTVDFNAPTAAPTRWLFSGVVLAWLVATIMALLAFFFEANWVRQVGIVAHGLTIAMAAGFGAYVISSTMATHTSDFLNGLGAIIGAILAFFPLLIACIAASIVLLLLFLLPGKHSNAGQRETAQ